MSLAEVTRAMKLRGFHANRAEFYEHLARSIRQKELLRSYLEEELRIARSSKTANASKAFALAEMLRRMRRAEDVALSRVVGGTMPESDRMMLAAVDESKDKAQTLEDVAAAVREQDAARKMLQTALMTPMILVPGILVFAFVLSVLVIPTIAKVAPEEVWTPYLSFVRAVAGFIGAWGAVVVAVGFLAILGFGFSLPRWTGSMRASQEGVSAKMATVLFPIAPWLLPLSLYRDFTAGTVLTTLAVLLNSGSTLTNALKLISKNGTPYVRWHMRRILQHLDQFSTEYVPAFGKGLLSARLLAMMASRIRNAPKFDAVLVDLGTQGNELVRAEVKRSAASINAILLIGGVSFLIFLYSGQALIADATAEAMDPMKRSASR